MKIVNRQWQRQIILEENIIHTLVFENKLYYREIIINLINQHNGEKGQFIFSKNNKELSLEKSSFLITDLFNIDVNDKKILSKIYSNLQKQILQEITEYNKLSMEIYNYFEKLILENSIPLEQKEEIDMASLIKLVGLKIQSEGSDVLETLVQYIKLLIELFNIEVVFIVGTHTFFTEDELKQFYKEICINKINIINIEFQEYKNNTVGGFREKFYIFDKENCEI